MPREGRSPELPGPGAGAAPDHPMGRPCVLPAGTRQPDCGKAHDPSAPPRSWSRFRLRRKEKPARPAESRGWGGSEHASHGPEVTGGGAGTPKTSTSGKEATTLSHGLWDLHSAGYQRPPGQGVQGAPLVSPGGRPASTNPTPVDRSSDAAGPCTPRSKTPKPPGEGQAGTWGGRWEATAPLTPRRRGLSPCRTPPPCLSSPALPDPP